MSVPLDDVPLSNDGVAVVNSDTAPEPDVKDTPEFWLIPCVGAKAIIDPIVPLALTTQVIGDVIENRLSVC